jgi:hypothetical protein
VLENPGALPRAYGVYRAECPASFNDQLARLAAPDFDLTQVVILDGDCRSEDNAQGISPAVSIESYEATRVRLTADMQRPGFIVLTDSYYPGWEAFVQRSNSASVLRTIHNERAELVSGLVCSLPVSPRQASTAWRGVR